MSSLILFLRPSAAELVVFINELMAEECNQIKLPSNKKEYAEFKLASSIFMRMIE